MFVVEFSQPSPAALATQSLHHPVNLETWHRHFGHIGESTLSEIVHESTVNGLAVTKMLTKGKNKDCVMGKQTCHLFDDDVEPKVTPYERVAFDLWGPVHVQIIGKAQDAMGTPSLDAPIAIQSNEVANVLEEVPTESEDF
ncbi:hypothetical protein E4T56_gene6959 [Termitomyces sp. T112]|nr:hypothetical protein E4T56_gene6959 [Termitomyces sp. T112]